MAVRGTWFWVGLFVITGPVVSVPARVSEALRSIENLDKAETRTKTLHEPNRVGEPNRDWLWLLVLIPSAFLILVVSSLSFPAFGM